MAVPEAPWQIDSKLLGYLLTSGLWSDCTFMVGSETNQTAVPAHKFILAEKSPVFEAMFYGGWSESNDPIVRIPDIYTEVFRALLQYIYTDTTEKGSWDFDMAWDLWYGAKKYMLPLLENECNSYIRSVLDPKNACLAYELACFFDEETLMDECIKFIRTNTKEVLIDSSFVDVQLNTVITVFSLDQLNVDSELDLFNAVARYAEAEQKRQGQVNPPEDEGLPSEELTDQLLSQSVESSQTSPAAEPDSKPTTEVVTSTSLADKTKLKKDEPTIRGALQKIRFLSLTVQQFEEGPAASGLLTETESIAVRMNMASTTRPVPMPTGFSECRAPRSVSMEQCIEAGCLEHIIKALKCGIPSQVKGGAISKLNIGHAGEMAEKAISVLGDIAWYKHNIRDAGLNLGALQAMLPYMHPDTPLKKLRPFVLAYGDMCISYNQPVSFELLSPALPHISELLALSDEQVLCNACWALVGLTYNWKERNETVQATPGLMERLIPLLGHSEPRVRTDALQAIANMLSGTDVLIVRCLEAGCLDQIINFLKYDELLFLKEHARAVRNILAKTDLHIQKALDKQILEPLIKVLSEGDVKCQIHAAWAVSHMCRKGTAEQLDVLVSAGFLEPYCLLLSSLDYPAVLDILEGLIYLLRKVVQTTRFVVCVKLSEIGLPKVVTTLQQHKDKKIRLQASHLMQSYFPDAVPADNAH